MMDWYINIYFFRVNTIVDNLWILRIILGYAVKTFCGAPL